MRLYDSPPALRVEFPGSQGAALSGRLELPEGRPRAFALFAHCFTCGKDAVAASRISRALTRDGFAVLRFDFTGLGHSGGDFASANFSSNIVDLVRAADYLRENFQAPRLLIGHSLGGTAVLAAIEQIPEVKAIVTIGAPADPRHVRRLITSDLATIDRDGVAEVNLGGRPFTVQRQFLIDLESQPPLERLLSRHTPLLVMHSPVDSTVAVDNARQIFDAAHHPKSFIALNDADHLLTRRTDAEFAARMIGAWASQYANDDVTDTDPVLMPSIVEPGEVQVDESGAGQFAQRVTTTSHVLSADEPAPLGTDTGPSPYELLLASLGACTSMTIRMYAERKGWPLRHVSVALKHSRIHAEDCANCESVSSHLDHIERVVTLDGDLSNQQRDSLIRIAEKCPVHRTLHAGVHVSTRLAGDESSLPGLTS